MAGGSIGDVLLRVLGEWQGFEAEAKSKGAKAGAESGKAYNQSFAGALKANAGKILGTGLAAGFAIATKGVMELEQATAEYRAETGATAEEARAAGKAINDMAGRNLQPMEEIGRALTKVRTDLGKTGPEAEKLTDRFLKFAHVTHMDAAEAVVGFDNVLDNWGLTADRAGEVMDKLIVSHQKYGGEINMNIDTLAKLAPALRAANFDIDDAIALLGLFGSKGLDADQATAAFAKSLTKVKSPKELDALIKDIAATEDPFLRASKAADLFGARAGAKLANALGGANLDSYIISMDEASGATEHAAEVLDSTFGAQAKLRIKQFGSALIGLGADFGPAVTGLASLSALGGGRLFDKMAGPIGKLGGRLGKKFALAMAGNAVIAAVADGLVTVVTKAGALPRTVAAFTSTGGKLGRALKGGLILGGTLLAADFILMGLDDINRHRDPETGKVARVNADLESRIANAKNVIKTLEERLVASPNDAFMQKQLAAQREALAKYEQQAHDGGVAAGGAYVAGFGVGLAQMRENNAITKTTSDVVGKTKSAAMNGGLDAGRGYMSAFYRGITQKQSVVQMALEAATSLNKTTMDKAQETAYLLGVLNSKEIAKGVTDKRQDVAAAYKETVRLALERLAKLAPESGNLSKKAWQELIKATKSKIPEVAKAAQALVDKIEGKLGKVKTKPAGHKAGKDFVTGAEDYKSAAFKAGAALAFNLLKGVLAKLKASGQSGTGTGHATGGLEEKGHARLVGEYRPEVFVPETAGRTYPNVAEGLAALGLTGGGDTFNINLLDRFPVNGVRDLGAGLTMLSRQGYLAPRRKKMAGSW